MSPDSMFRWLVDFHIDVNLARCLPYLADGRVLQRGRPIEEMLENDLYKGVLIASFDSEDATLADRLNRDKVVLDDMVSGITDINGRDDFISYLLSQEDSDGAYIYDRQNCKIIHAEELNNHIPLPEGRTLCDYLPRDFFTYGKNSQQRIGTKTRLAIKIPIGYDNTETYQIKRSAYGPFGMGKVTHFDKNGLVEEFFLQIDPKGAGQDKIQGVYRKYNGASDRTEYVVPICQADGMRATCRVSDLWDHLAACELETQSRREPY